MMNVLVAYYSQSGNTETIANAIWDEASHTHEADLKKLEDTTPAEVAGCDVVFLGSPLHSGSLAAPVKEWLGHLQARSGQQLAGFITHFAPAYPEQDMETFAAPLKAACRGTGITYMGCFDCQGALIESLHEAVQKKLKLSDEQWADMVRQMTGHPNDEDVANANAFARDVLG